MKRALLCLTALAISSSALAHPRYRVPRPDRLSPAKDVSYQVLQSALTAMVELDRQTGFGPGPGGPGYGPRPDFSGAAVQAERDAHELFHAISSYLRPQMPGSVPVARDEVENDLDRLANSHYQLAQLLTYNRAGTPVAVDAVNAMGRGLETLEAMFSPWNDAREIGARMEASLRFAADVAFREKTDLERRGVDMRTAARMNMAVQKLQSVAQAASAARIQLNAARPDFTQVSMALRQIEQQVTLTRGVLQMAPFSPNVSTQFEKGVGEEAQLAAEVNSIGQ